MGFEIELSHMGKNIRIPIWCAKIGVSCIYIVVGQGKSTRGQELFLRNEALRSLLRNFSGLRVEFPCPRTIHHDGYIFPPTL